MTEIYYGMIKKIADALLTFCPLVIVIITYYYFSMRRALNNFTSTVLQETTKSFNCLFLIVMITNVANLFFGIALRTVLIDGTICSKGTQWIVMASLSVSVCIM